MTRVTFAGGDPGGDAQRQRQPRRKRRRGCKRAGDFGRQRRHHRQREQQDSRCVDDDCLIIWSRAEEDLSWRVDGRGGRRRKRRQCDKEQRAQLGGPPVRMDDAGTVLGQLALL